MSNTVGSISLNLSAATSEFISAFQNAERVVLSFENKASKSLSSVDKKVATTQNVFSGFSGAAAVAFGNLASSAIIGATQATTDFAKTAFGSAVAFEAQMSSIQALTDSTDDQILSIGKLSQTLGKDLGFTSIEAAKGIEELLKAGVSLDSVINGGLAAALSLAAAGGISVADAATVASTSANAFSRDGISAAKVADIIAGAANASATDVHGLRMGLAQAASSASAAGFSLLDTSTALALFANKGFQGSDAGTSLKTMLLRLIPATNKTAGMFDELGFTVNGANNVFFDSEGKMKSLSEISEILQSKLGKLTDEQKTFTATQLFGTDAQRAAVLLTGAGAEGIDELSKKIAEGATAEEIAAKRMDNLAGATKRWNATIEALTTSAILAFLPTLTENLIKTTESVENLFNLIFKGDYTGSFFGVALEEDTKLVDIILTTRERFLDLIETLKVETPKAIQSIKDFFQWIKDNKQPIVISLAAIAGGVGGLATKMALLNISSSGGFLFWMAALTKNALGARAGLFMMNVATAGLIPTLWSMAVAGWAAIAPFIPFILIGAAVAAAIALTIIYWDDLVWAFGVGIKFLVKAFDFWWETTQNNFNFLKTLFGDFFGGIWKGITDFFNNATTSTTDFGNSLYNGVTGFFNSILIAVQTWVTDTGNAIYSFLTPVINVFTTISNYVGSIFAVLFYLGQVAMYYLGTGLSMGLLILTSKIEAFKNAAIQRFTVLWDLIVHFGTQFYNAFVQPIVNGFEWWVGVVKDNFEIAKSFFVLFTNFVRHQYDMFNDGFIQPIIRSLQWMSEQIWKKIDTIKYTIGLIGVFFVNQAIMFNNNFIQPFVQGLNWLLGIVDQVAQTIKDVLGNVFNGLKDMAVWGFKSAINAIIDNVNRATGFLNGLVDGIPELPGITKPGKIPTIPRLNAGGQVTAGMPYIVGDNPDGSLNPTSELFVPDRSGSVLSSSMLQGLLGSESSNNSGEVTQIFNMQAVSFDTAAVNEFFRKSRQIAKNQGYSVG